MGSADLTEFLRGSTPARPEISRAMYPDGRRRLERFIAMEPAWIIGGEHVRFDPKLRELRRDLQRSLHADTAGRREVETHDQNLHGPG